MADISFPALGFEQKFTPDAPLLTTLAENAAISPDETQSHQQTGRQPGSAHPIGEQADADGAFSG
nr:hypothetical protein [Marinicella sp. W31]MDC2878198.1 hypothetical protein [Marinicella sp. W31]